jgi:hypothetical protein
MRHSCDNLALVASHLLLIQFKPTATKHEGETEMRKSPSTIKLPRILATGIAAAAIAVAGVAGSAGVGLAATHSAAKPGPQNDVVAAAPGPQWDGVSVATPDPQDE